MPRKWFNRLLLSYLPIFFVVISILIVISFLFIYQLSQREAVKANRIYAEHVMQTVDHYLRATDQMVMKEIQGTETFDAFFEEGAGSEQPWVNYQTNLKLRQLERALPLFSTIYLYRNSDQSILNPLYGLSNIGAFWDRDFIDGMIQSGETPTHWSPIRPIFAEDQTQYVTTLVRKVPLLSGGQGLVVINVHADSLQRMMSSMTNSNLTYIQLEDQADTDVFFVGQPAGETSPQDATELSTVRSGYTGWTIMSGFQAKQWFDIFSLFSYVWFAVALCSVILGVAWIVLMSHKNNKPIQSILDSIQAYSKQRNRSFLRHPSRDELGYIQSAVHNLLQESSEMDKQNKENLTYKRRMLFQEWVEGSRVVSPVERAEEWPEFKPDFPLQQVGLMLVEIDDYDKFADQYNPRDQALLKYTVKQVLKEMADEEESLSVWSEWMSDRRMAAVCLSSDAAEPGWHALAERYLDWVNEKLDFTVTIGLGGGKKDMDGVPYAYSEAKRALSHKITFGRQRIIDHRDIATLNQMDTTRYLPLLETIIQNFKQGAAGWPSELTQLFERFKEDRISIQYLTSLLSNFNYQIQQEMNKLSYDYVEVWNSGASLLSEIEDARFESLDDIFAHVMDWLKNKELRLQQIRDNHQYRESMIHIKKYIESNYHNVDLSLNHLSGLFHIQPSYLSRMFKEELGEKFVDYLVKVRIHHAKSMLAETDEPIQSIAQKVGYTHVVSFTRAFKKITGIPPGEYRKAVKPANR